MTTDRIEFSHPAMNTTFLLQLMSKDHATPEAIAREAFELLDYLEDRLSLYREGSDVRRINAMEQGDSLVISEACHQCLLEALDLNQQTAGYFDVTIGKQIQLRKHHQNEGDSTHQIGQLALNPQRPVVDCIQPGRAIDLGGIGKGFAVDQITQLLRSHNISSACISAGNSCHRAIGHWFEECRIPLDNENVSTKRLCQNAISSSGDLIQGAHIVSPHDPQLKDINRAWVIAHNATQADAWSTAAAIMPIDQFVSAAKQTPGLQSALIKIGQSIHQWPHPE
jgi:thiamine biosynthesis lipoprotein